MFNLKVKDRGLIIIFILALIFVVSFAFINMLKFRTFSSTYFGWQCFYNYSKLAEGKSIFNVYILPEYAVISFFLIPINFLVAFIYSFFLRPEILSALQSIAIASGCLPIYLIAKNRFNNSYLGVAFSISYLLHPIVTTGAMLGYIPPVIGLPFLLSAFYYLEKDNYAKFIFFIIIANMSKIDMVIATFILGVILSFSKEQKKYGRIVSKISLIWLIIAMVFCVIYLKLINKPFPAPLLHFDKYGDRLIDALRFFMNYPFLILKNIFNLNNMLIYVFCYLPNIFSFFSLRYILPIIPELGFLLIRNQHSSGHFIILAFVFVGGIYGLEKIINIIGKVFFKHSGRELKRSLLYKILGTIILFTALFQHYFIKPKCDFSDNLGPIPFTKHFNFRFYKPTEHIMTGYKFLSMIPSEASCLTQQSLATHLGRCRYVGRFDRYSIRQAYSWDYIFVDLFKNDYYQIDKKEYFLTLKKFLEEKNYGVLCFEDGWLLLKKGYSQNKNLTALIYINQFLQNEDKAS